MQYNTFLSAAILVVQLIMENEPISETQRVKNMHKLRTMDKIIIINDSTIAANI
jgi:hypothetical protein